MDVVAGKNENAAETLFAQDINVLQDCVGCPEIPGFSSSELGGTENKNSSKALAKIFQPSRR
jgi:hypothetical protein